MHHLPLASLVCLLAFWSIVSDAAYCPFPAATKQTTVDAVINVAKGANMNFNYARLTATSKLRSSCDINGSANGKHIINIADGGSISNVILADPAKGVWCEGSCTLTNVYFEKVCYHAAGFASPGNGNTAEVHKVVGGAATNVPDKIFTQSSPGETIIDGFCAEKFSRVYRSCGSGCVQYTRKVTIKNSKFKGPGSSLIGLNKNRGDSMSISNIVIDGYNSGAQIKYACQETNEPNTSTVNQYKPTEDGKGTSCKYSKSAISIKS